MNASSLYEDIQKEVQACVASGKQIRERVAALVAQAVLKAQEQADGARKLVAAVTDGALEGVAKEVRERKAERLMQVVEGVGDGLEAAASAARLTLSEAAGRGQQFAREDLKRMRYQLDLVQNMIAILASETGKRWSEELSAQYHEIKAHCQRTSERVKPSFEAALKALKADPAGVAREAGRTGMAAATNAAGVLFTEIGQQLERLGTKLRK
jgi:hypothetical protein